MFLAIKLISDSIRLIPMVYLGSQFWGTTGFFCGIALGNFATGILAWTWFRSLIFPGALAEKI